MLTFTRSSLEIRLPAVSGFRQTPTLSLMRLELRMLRMHEYLIMTGGPGDGAIHETQAMRLYAITAGVPDERILVDESGWNTELSVAGTVPLCREHGLSRLLVISHGFHLPRIKLAFARAGRDVYTVPAPERFPLPGHRFLLARETAALWAYYAAPLGSWRSNRSEVSSTDL
ncbi:hypothetical protein GC176_23380 [bacterium]|nr:hypothetical protein [bacterium]